MNFRHHTELFWYFLGSTQTLFVIFITPDYYKHWKVLFQNMYGHREHCKPVQNCREMHLLLVSILYAASMLVVTFQRLFNHLNIRVGYKKNRNVHSFSSIIVSSAVKVWKATVSCEGYKNCILSYWCCELYDILDNFQKIQLNNSI